MASKEEKKPTEKKLMVEKSPITEKKTPSKVDKEEGNKKLTISLKTLLYYLEKKKNTINSKLLNLNH